LHGRSAIGQTSARRGIGPTPKQDFRSTTTALFRIVVPERIGRDGDLKRNRRED